MKLHGENVVVGDDVFDVSINRGTGTVASISQRGIEVAFGLVRVFYASNGVQSGRGRATLFWHDPVFVIPRKKEEHWSLQRKLATDINDGLKGAL